MRRSRARHSGVALEPALARPAPEPAANALERLVERALQRAAARAVSRTEKVRRSLPGGAGPEVVARLERRYVRSVSATSALIGLSAAVPGVGTGIALGLTAVNTVGFLRTSTTFISSVAQVHGVAVEDLSRRRTLLLASVLGHDGERAVHGRLGVSTLYWGRGLLTRLPLSTVRAVNRGLTRRLARLVTAKGGVLLLGRLAPFGIGAVIGWFAGRALARQVVVGARDAFGPLPATPTTPAQAG